MQPILLNMVRQTYIANGLGSDTLFAALDDPNIEVPDIDGKYPKMTRLEEGKQIEQLEHNHHSNRLT